MTFLRRFGFFASLLLFCAGLAIFAFLAGLHSIFNTPQTLKAALDESGIYKEITPNIAKEQLAALSLPPQDIGIKNALEQALPAPFYQQASEQIVDGTYAWMQGRAAQPEFSIDTAAVKSNFASNVAVYMKQQMEALPECERDMPPPTSARDALTLFCLPKHVTPDAVADAARQQVLASDAFGKDDTITAATLKDGQGRTLAEQLAFLPPLYQAYVPTLIALPVIILLLGVALVFLSKDRRTGLRRAAWALLVMGLVGLVFAAAGTEIFYMAVRIFGLPVTLAFETQDKLVATIELLATNARPWWFGISLGYALLGTVLFVILRLRRPKPALKFSGQ